MSKLQIPKSSIVTGGDLKDWYYSIAMIPTDVDRQVVDDISEATGDFDLSMDEIDGILDVSGEVFEQLMAIRVTTLLFLEMSVPDTLPNWSKFNGSGEEVHKTFAEWLLPGAEWWIKDDNTELIFYTNPFAGNADKYLTGTEIKIIEQINPVFVSVIKTSEVPAIVETGWTKK